jgi:hypothetical protein
MSYGLIDDALWRNLKTASFTDAEHRLWVNAISWCRANRSTRGIVTFSDLQAVAARYGLVTVRKLKAVVAGVEQKRGFDLQSDGSWLVHDYRQVYARDEVLSEKRAAAGRVGGLAKASHQPVAKGPDLLVAKDPSLLLSRAGARQDPSPTPPPRRTVASPYGDAKAVLKTLRSQVFALWAEHQGWESWNEHREDAVRITNWLADKPYPLEFWQAVMAQVPTETQKFAHLTTPRRDGETCWVEDRFIEWQDSRYAAEKAERRELAPVVTFMPRAMP